MNNCIPPWTESNTSAKYGVVISTQNSKCMLRVYGEHSGKYRPQDWPIDVTLRSSAKNGINHFFYFYWSHSNQIARTESQHKNDRPPLSHKLTKKQNKKPPELQKKDNGSIVAKIYFFVLEGYLLSKNKFNCKTFMLLKSCFSLDIIK